MFKLKQQFISYKLLNGKKVLTEKLFKHLIKQTVRNVMKPFHYLFQLIISYLCFVFKYNVKSLKRLYNSKLLFFFKSKVLSSLKFLANNIKNNKQFNLLTNFNIFLWNKNQLYSKMLEYKKLLLFFRW